MSTGLKDEKVQWYYGRIFVIAMLFLVVGPLALPLLWMSPRFNLIWKIIITLLVILFTWLIIKGIAASWSLALKSLENLNSPTAK